MPIDESKGKVRVEREYTEGFEINTGVRQGDEFSPVLFNLAIEEALRRVKQISGGAYIGGKIMRAYADDVALIVENRDDLKALADKMLVEASKVGLMVNGDKTQYMKVSREAEN